MISHYSKTAAINSVEALKEPLRLFYVNLYNILNYPLNICKKASKIKKSNEFKRQKCIDISATMVYNGINSES